MKRVIQVDAQGERELMEITRKTNARLAEIEARYRERSDGAADLPILRVFAMRAPKGTKPDSLRKDIPPT
jgi:hypothetical protein